ncbi:MAG: hypothetical protein GKS01_11880 [Alphaproteobacteria bacterium]|nr:hypothetical protein [Alphaproteobacteria bacterium]
MKQRLEQYFNSVVLWVFVGTVLITPIPFGSVRLWSYTLLALIISLILIAWTLRYLISDDEIPVPYRKLWFLFIPFLLAMLWIVVQIGNWSPQSWHNSIWTDATQVLGEDIPGSISVAPDNSLIGLMRYLTYAGIFFLAVQFGHSRRNARRILIAISLTGGLYAIYGLAVHFSGTNSILWYPKKYYLNSLTSTFVYKNAFATYAGICLICITGLLLQSCKDILNQSLGPRETLLRYISALLNKGWILIGILFSTSAALFMSGSRMGIVASVIAMLVLFLVSRLTHGKSIPYFGLVTAFFTVIILTIALSSGKIAFDRLSTLESDNNLRQTIYDQTIEAIKESPLRGTGASTFSVVFPKWRVSTIPNPVLRAHSSYLENMLELGIPAFSLILVTMAGIAVGCYRGIKTRQDNVLFPCIGLSVLTLTGVHAIFDFTLQVPAVTATLMLVVGVAYAQSWSSREK